jgi:hypothetical protein
VTRKLYLDGCSLTYGKGLDRDQSLGSLYQTIGGYTVTDKSRPAKSNAAIAVDTYNHWHEHEVFVLGFTYSSRFGLGYRDQNINFYTGFHGKGLGLQPLELDIASTEVHKYFYTVFEPPWSEQFSNMLIDGLVSFLISKNKIVLPFSWESRTTVNKVFYPYIGPKERLDDGHLNAHGTKRLFDYLQNQINV